MRDIAKLLFGKETGILSGLFGPGDGDGFSAVESVRRSGEWCGSTPSRGAGAGLRLEALRPDKPEHRVTFPF